MARRSRLTEGHARSGSLLSALLVSATCGLAQEAGSNVQDGQSGNYICHETGRMLTDDEILEMVFRHERVRGTLPERFADSDFTALRDHRRSCCSIRREDNPYNRHRGWLSHLFEPYHIQVVIGWDEPEVIVPEIVTTYRMTPCGAIVRRQGSTSPSR